MAPGITTRGSQVSRTRDDADELLSGVYYIDVPPDSGNLVLMDGIRREEIQSREGMFVFFAPELLYEATRYESGRPRLSIGFNIGPVQAP